MQPGMLILIDEQHVPSRGNRGQMMHRQTQGGKLTRSSRNSAKLLCRGSTPLPGAICQPTMAWLICLRAADVPVDICWQGCVFEETADAGITRSQQTRYAGYRAVLPSFGDLARGIQAADDATITCNVLAALQRTKRT